MSYRLNDPGGTRTDEEAKESIKVNTARENVAKKIIEKDLNCRGQVAKILDRGVDNSGKFIEEDSKVNGEPDWTIVIDDIEYPVEACVHSSRFGTVSFKTCKLRKAIKRSGSIFVIRESLYLVFDSSACEYLLDNFPVRNVKGIMGGKDAIILSDPKDVDKLISDGIVRKYQYKEDAQALIDDKIGFMFNKGKD